MINVRRHHPVLLHRLQQHFEAEDAYALMETLSHLSAADFRTAGYLLSEKLLPQYPQLFWDFFLQIVPSRPKAFLGTFLKAALELYETDENTLDFDSLQKFSQEFATPIDARKCLEYFLPEIHSTAHAQRLLNIFQQEEATALALILIKAGTPICYYLLFLTLQAADESEETLRHYCLLLMKKGDSLSFNMAVILRSYFGLSSLPGTFSMNLEPYQLGRLNDSYENFEQMLLGSLK